jgi:hypothetical protein
MYLFFSLYFILILKLQLRFSIVGGQRISLAGNFLQQLCFAVVVMSSESLSFLHELKTSMLNAPANRKIFFILVSVLFVIGPSSPACCIGYTLLAVKHDAILAREWAADICKWSEMHFMLHELYKKPNTVSTSNSGYH